MGESPQMAHKTFQEVHLERQIGILEAVGGGGGVPHVQKPGDNSERAEALGFPGENGHDMIRLLCPCPSCAKQCACPFPKNRRSGFGREKARLLGGESGREDKHFWFR